MFNTSLDDDDGGSETAASKFQPSRGLAWLDAIQDEAARLERKSERIREAASHEKVAA